MKIENSNPPSKSNESDLEVLLTYGFFDEVLAATDALRKTQPEVFLRKARIALFRLTALHESNRLREAALLLPETQHLAVELGGRDFVTWCLIGLDCGLLELVSEVTEKHLLKSVIRFGKRPAGSLDSFSDQTSNTAVCCLYAFEILCVRSKEYDKAEAWVLGCVLLSKEQKKVLVDRIYQAEAKMQEIGSGGEYGVGEKPAQGISSDPEVSIGFPSTLSSIKEKLHEVGVPKNSVFAVVGALVILSAVANRKRLKKSVDGFWDTLRASFVEVSRHAFGLNLGQG
ncbi:hypothetical protein BSKO_13896 [Bryopsis sp. KO-2023]|nr:hypothetical protein BSKO_13896 [Bryopsis sp. KO-2023]